MVALRETIAIVLMTACAKPTTVGSAKPENTMTEMKVGEAFVRKCNGRTETLALTALSCMLTAKPDRVAIFGDTDDGQPLFSAGFGSLVLETRLTGTTQFDTLLLQNRCAANAASSPEPCRMTLVELTRGEPRGNKGAPEIGAHVKLEISCPEKLTYTGDDDGYATTQTPRRFTVEASDCASW